MNIFTNDDYRRIQAWLKANAIKDSDLVQSETTIPDEDILTIVQKVNGIPTNFKINIKDFLNSSLNKIIIELFTVNAIKVNNSLVVDIDKIIINEEENLTLQAVFDSFNNQLNDVSSASKGWNIEYQAPSIDEPTVRAKYVLKDYKGVPKGDPIKVYKDSAITNVYLGTTEDTCNENTGKVTKKPIQNNNEALSIVYRLDTGKYSLVNIPIGIFIKEAEFDKYRGLGITENGQVFIKLANDVESSNYLHFNDSGEVSADGIESRILQDLGTIINSVADDGTMWGQYKKEEGTKDSPTNEASRWGQYKQAEADRNERLNNLENKFEETKQAIIYDVSAHNNNAVFESLSALLNSSDLNTLIPTSVRHGGMSIKFIQSSDNKYVQYRLMSTLFSTNESDWQGVDDEPTAGSDNLVKSGGVADKLVELESRTDGISKEIIETEEEDIIIEDNSGNQVVEINSTGADFKNLKSDGVKVAKVGDSYTKSESDAKYVTDISGKADKVDVRALQDKTSEISKEYTEIGEDTISIEDNNGNEVFHLDEKGLDAKNMKSNGKDVLTEHQDISMLATKEEVAMKQDVIHQIGKRATSSINSDYIFASDDYDEEQGKGEKYAYINELGISAKGFYDLDGNNVLKKDIHLTVETQDLQSVRESNTVCTINNSSAYDVETSKDSILLSIEERVVAGSLLSFFLRIDSKYQEFGDITIFGLNENKLTVVTETIHYNAPIISGANPCISMPLREYYRISLLSKSSTIKYIKIKLNNNGQPYLIRVAKKVEVNNKFSVTPVLIIQDGGQYMTPITDDGETYTNHWDWMVSKNIPFACAIALSRWNLPTRMEDIPEDASESYRDHVWHNRVTNELRNIVKNGKADFITYNGDLAPFAKKNDFGTCISKNIELREAIGIWSYGIVNTEHAINEELCKCYLCTGYKWYRAPYQSTCIGGIKYENTVTPVRTLHISSVLDESKFWGIPTIVWSHGIAGDNDVIGEPIFIEHYKHLKHLEEERKIKLCTTIEFENFFK